VASGRTACHRPSTPFINSLADARRMFEVCTLRPRAQHLHL
jgi:hypothetical protein